MIASLGIWLSFSENFVPHSGMAITLSLSWYVGQICRASRGFFFFFFSSGVPVLSGPFHVLRALHVVLILCRRIIGLPFYSKDCITRETRAAHSTTFTLWQLIVLPVSTMTPGKFWAERTDCTRVQIPFLDAPHDEIGQYLESLRKSFLFSWARSPDGVLQYILHTCYGKI